MLERLVHRVRVVARNEATGERHDHETMCLGEGSIVAALAWKDGRIVVSVTHRASGAGFPGLYFPATPIGLDHAVACCIDVETAYDWSSVPPTETANATSWVTDPVAIKAMQDALAPVATKHKTRTVPWMDYVAARIDDDEDDGDFSSDDSMD